MINPFLSLFKLLFRSAWTVRHWQAHETQGHVHIRCAFTPTHTHKHTHAQITNIGCAATYGNMRLMMNGLPGPVPIPLEASLGCHVCVITLDVILFPLTEAM